MGNDEPYNVCKKISSWFFSGGWKKAFFIIKNSLKTSLKYIAKKIRFFILMILPLFIFFSVLIPPLFNRYPIFFNYPVSLPHVYTLEGIVKNKKKNNLSKVSIIIGGFNAETDDQGKFKLTFLAKYNKDIPVIFSRNGKDSIQKINYTNSHKINQTFYIK